jgi:sugar transferase (PEP-CTERM/EpsH1 system associated)
MAQRQHQVDVFTLADDPEDLEHGQSLSMYCNEVTVRAFSPRVARLRSLFFLPTSKPLTLPYFYSDDLARAVDRAIRTRGYDRLFVYCSAMAQYVRDAQGIPVIADIVDVDSDKWRQYADYVSFPMSWVYRREAARLAEYERSVCLMAAATIVATRREAGLLKDICNTANVRVIRNGINEAAAPAIAARTGRPTVVFTGDMAYFPNEHAVDYFARQVLPRVRSLIPETRFLIVGRNPGRGVRKLAALPGVEVTGTVPDVRTYLAEAHVSVAPFLISAGIPNKILEAMTCDLPVVATSRAIQGLDAEVSSVVFRADDAERMASAVSTLLGDRELAHRSGAEGHRLVSAAYNWDRSLAELLDLVEHPFGATTGQRFPSVV